MEHVKKTKPETTWKLSAEWVAYYCNHCRTEWAERNNPPATTCEYCGKEINPPQDNNP